MLPIVSVVALISILLLSGQVNWPEIDQIILIISFLLYPSAADKLIGSVGGGSKS
jgi:hypothetical protein